MHISPVDIILRSVVLTLVFLVLIYLFRGKVAVEGFGGYMAILFLFVPVNVYLGSGGAFPGRDMLTAAHMTVAIVVFNIAAGLILSKVVSGISVTSYSAFIVFLVLFSLVSGAIHYVPAVPTIQSVP